MPGRGAEFDYFQSLAEQLDTIGGLRALVTAVEHAGRKMIGTVIGADRDVFRPQCDPDLVVRPAGMQQRDLALPSFAEVDRAELAVARDQPALELVGRA